MKKLLVPSLLAVSGVACAAQQKDKPNVLMIVCDQLRYDCLGYTGSPFARTPNIDALAAEGMQFTRAYTSIRPAVRRGSACFPAPGRSSPAMKACGITTSPCP